MGEVGVEARGYVLDGVGGGVGGVQGFGGGFGLEILNKGDGCA